MLEQVLVAAAAAAAAAAALAEPGSHGLCLKCQFWHAVASPSPVR